MKLLPNNLSSQQKKLLILIAIAVCLIFLSFRFFATKVAANIVPIRVYEVNIDFGTVFPGEELQEDFIIYGTTTEGVNYGIIKKPKPKWPEPPICGQNFTSIEEARAYCLSNPNNTNCCYPSLCPFLTPISVEGEGDTATSSSVGLTDLSDAWIIYFKVPAIFGHVAQDYTGGVVSEGGDYGCDISIDILE